MADFLFELGVEEVPVSEILSVENQLRDKFISEFKENLIDFGTIETSATNTRFMIYIKDINEKTRDKEDLILGPSNKIAFDDDGNPTIPLKKFLESNGCEVKDIVKIEQKKGTYVGVNKKTPGMPVPELLEEIVPKILSEINFKKAMVWNESRVPFVRPIKNLLVLFNSDLIELEFAGITSSNTVYGHNLLSEESIEISSFKEYIESLRNNFVLGKAEERREKILEEIKDIEDEFAVSVKLDEKMLEYFVYNNEYPVVFSGDFDEKYLQIPEEIISTFMVNEKKLVPVYNNESKMSNLFVGVSNVPDENNYVAEGNKRVVVATFEDAKFFWDNDRADDFIALRDELKNVLFHKKIGSFYEKTERLKGIVEYIAKITDNTEMTEDLVKAASYSKNDLVTRMVREFPSLQGIMGGLYLKEKGEKETVWKSVYGHYEPKGYTEEKSENLSAGLLSIADKIDNIIGFIANGIKISSSKDPYGIRRDANAILKVILDFRLDFNLMDLISFVAKYFSNEENQNQLTDKVREFFELRIKGVFKEPVGYRYDVINSVLNGKGLNVYKLFLRAKDIHFLIDKNSVETIIALHKRLKNIVKGQQNFELSETALTESSEKILYDVFTNSNKEIIELIDKGNNIEAYSKIIEMKPIIDDFFDNILVMSDDEDLRNNRIALIQSLDALLSEIADFSMLVEGK
jgi:glycyl-tRNA synthetase beta chain